MLVRRDPFSELASLFGTREPFQPAIDIYEDKESMVVQAEVPGFKPEQLQIEVAGNVLTLHGEKSQQQEQRAHDYYQSERTSGAFTRSFVLPSNVDPDTAEASMEHGVLTIRIHRKPGVGGRRIPIKSAAVAQRASDPGGSFRRPPADS